MASTLTVPVQSRLRIFLGNGNDEPNVRLFGRSIPASVHGGVGSDLFNPNEINGSPDDDSNPGIAFNERPGQVLDYDEDLLA